MPASSQRRRFSPDAGPAIVEDPPPAPAAPPVVAPRQPADDERPVKFTAVLDQQTVATFETVTNDMRRVGRLAGGRYPSRADVLRAVVALVAEDDELAARVAERITTDLTARANR